MEEMTLASVYKSRLGKKIIAKMPKPKPVAPCMQLAANVTAATRRYVSIGSGLLCATWGGFHRKAISSAEGGFLLPTADLTENDRFLLESVVFLWLATVLDDVTFFQIIA